MTRLLLFCLFLTWAACPAVAQDYELSYLLIRSSDGKVIAEKEAAQLRVPASTMKLVTAAAAVEQLGLEHTFETAVSVNSIDKRGRAKELCLRGEADPRLELENLEELADQVRQFGVRRVTGDLLIDPGPYAFPPYGGGWSWDDAGYGYSPEISGLNLNGGVWEIDPESPPAELRASDKLKKGFRLVPGVDGVIVGAELPTRLALPNTALRTGELFLKLLEGRGIKVDGVVREGRLKGEVVARHSSSSVEEILRQGLAESDNLTMELLFRASNKMLPDALTEARMRRVDGSGLSRYNLISCRQLVTLLQQSPRLKPLLPGPGEGTLRKRFRDGWSAGNVRAKTGTMSNISGLAGFLFPDTEKECCFAILINGHLASTKERKAIEDQLVETWCREIGWPYLVDEPKDRAQAERTR